MVHFPQQFAVPLLAPPPNDWKGCVFSRFIDNGIANDDADIEFGAQSSATGDWNAWEWIGPDGEPVSPGVCTMSANGLRMHAVP